MTIEFKAIEFKTAGEAIQEANANTYVAAMAAIKATPVGEAGQYLRMAFFRDDRRQITIIRNHQAQQFNNDHGAAELVRIHL